MSVTDSLLVGHEAQTAARKAQLVVPPAKKLAVVTCMDARIDVFRILNLQAGDAHIMRNAGGIVTEDMLRSLIISQRLLGTDEIVLMHHTLCGQLTYDDDAFRDRIDEETGERPGFSFLPFPDLKASVREGMHAIKTCPFIKSPNVRGFVLDIQSDELEEVTA